MTEAPTPGKERASGGPPTMTETFSTISDSLTTPRTDPRTMSHVRATGPLPEREEVPPAAQQERPGGTKGGAVKGEERKPCQHVTVRASGPCADMSQVACPLCSNMEGPRCDCGLCFCLAHASRVEDAGRHGADQGGVPATQAKPQDTTTVQVTGAAPFDLPPREMNPPRLVPTPTRGAVSQGPPPELIPCQYIEHQNPKECHNLSRVECPLHRPEEGILCECGFRLCGSHAVHIESPGLHEGQRRSRAPPPKRRSLQIKYRSRSRQ